MNRSGAYAPSGGHHASSSVRYSCSAVAQLCSGSSEACSSVNGSRSAAHAICCNATLYTPFDSDASVATKILKSLKLRVYDGPLTVEGGAIHVDGRGTLLVTEQCLLNENRNPELTRQQMFTFGYRPRTFQQLKLAADGEGRLRAIEHKAIGQTSRFEDFTEHEVEWSGMLYACDNVRLGYRLARRNPQ